MIIDGLRTLDFLISAGTLLLKRLMSNTILFVDWLVKFGPEIVISCFPTYRFFDDMDKARKGV